MGHGGHRFFIDGSHSRSGTRKMDRGFSVFPSFDASSSSSSSSPPASSSNNNNIEHRVSKLDTLAGIAIKYGVEVSDIKRMNGLVTDLQMFAHKTLQIPHPGRHPPSAALSNNSQIPRTVASGLPPRHGMQTAYCSSASDSINALKPKNYEKRPISLAMNLLRGYYGLASTDTECDEGMEMAVYKTDSDAYSEDEPFTPPRTSAIDGPKGVRSMSKSSLNGDPLMKAEKRVIGEDFLRTDDDPFLKELFVTGTGGNETEKASESSVRRRSKVEGIGPLIGHSSENVFKQDGSFTGRVGKGPSLRSKAGSRVSLSSDATCTPGHPFAIGDSFMADGFVGGLGVSNGLGAISGNEKSMQESLSKIRKSSSTSSLQDSGKTSPIKLSSRWASKGDSQGLLSSAVSRPIFEAIPRPPNGRRNKAALD